MMSVHDAIEAWQSGDLTTARAMQLTGATDVMDLYAFAHECDVEVRTDLLPREEEQAALAIEFIDRLRREEDGAAGAARQDIAAK